MSNKVQSYLFFDGRAEEAAEFYKTALGAKVEMLLRFRDNPEPQDASAGCGPGAGHDDKVMHMALQIGDTTIMASDGDCKGQAAFQGLRSPSPCRTPRPSTRRSARWARAATWSCRR